MDFILIWDILRQLKINEQFNICANYDEFEIGVKFFELLHNLIECIHCVYLKVTLINIAYQTVNFMIFLFKVGHQDVLALHKILGNTGEGRFLRTTTVYSLFSE